MFVFNRWNTQSWMWQRDLKYWVRSYLAAAASTDISPRLRSLSWERRGRRRGHTWYNLSSSLPAISQIWPLLWRLPCVGSVSTSVASKKEGCRVHFLGRGERATLIRLGNLLTLASASLVYQCTCACVLIISFLAKFSWDLLDVGQYACEMKNCEELVNLLTWLLLTFLVLSCDH